MPFSIGTNGDGKPELAIMIARRAQKREFDKDKMFGDVGKDVRAAIDQGDDVMLGKIMMAAARLSRDLESDD